ncbi:helix-turn-helix transcriptional regulator, partial [Amycolatopsis coloradensis]
MDTGSSMWHPGKHLRRLRAIQGKSQEVVAGLAGITPSYLSRLETGERRLDDRRLVTALAEALEVSPAELLGQPVRHEDADLAAAQGTVAPLRAAYLSTVLGAVPAVGGQVRGPDELTAAVQRGVGLRTACDFTALGRLLPGLLVELHHLVATDATARRGAARRGALEALHVACASASVHFLALGYPMEAVVAADRAAEVAAELGGAWPALAAFSQVTALLPTGTHDHAYRIASEATDAARGLSGQITDQPAQAAYGALLLASSLTASVTGRAEEAADRLAEAGTLAEQVG